MRFETVLATRVITETLLHELAKTPDIQWDELPYFTSVLVAEILHPEHDLYAIINLPQEHLILLSTKVVLDCLPTIAGFATVWRIGSKDLAKELHDIVKKTVQENPLLFTSPTQV